MAQKDVNKKQAFGLVGEFYDSSVKVVTSYIASTDVTCGNPVYFTTDGKIAATGTTFAGIVVNPKEYVNQSGDLASSLVVKAGQAVSVASKGHIIIKAAGAIAVGDSVGYTTANSVTGWQTVSSGALGKAVITAAAANELAVIEL